MTEQLGSRIKYVFARERGQQGIKRKIVFIWFFGVTACAQRTGGFLCLKKNYRPVSRILFSGHHGPEPLPFIWRQASLPASALPTLPVGGRSPAADEPPTSRNPGNRVYLAFQPARFTHAPCCHGESCALTAHFHPYRVAAAVIFCGTCCAPGEPETPPVRWCGALRCPDFPPCPQKGV